jgi:peptidyl-dipeptidase A
MTGVGPASLAPPARQAAVEQVIERVVAELEPLQRAHNEALWAASVTGLAVHAEQRARLDAQIRAIFSRPQPCAFLREALEAGGVPDPLVHRQLVVLLNLFRAHQMPPPILQRMVELEKELDCKFDSFRAELDGSRVADDRLREILEASDDLPLRRRAWEASKQIGGVVVGDLLELVRLRNDAAHGAGFTDYYTMMLELDELDESELFEVLDALDRGTRPLFEAYRQQLDGRLARRFGVAPAEIRPWHLSDPFFQEAPAAGLDLDACFRNRDIVQVAEAFFAAVGFDIRDLLGRADLRARTGKSQHAFCLSVDRGADVRVLCNVQPTEFWMSVLLHELGHAVYDQAIARSLPYLLRAPAHTLTTEASAVLFGRLSKNTAWLARHAGLGRVEARRLGAETRSALRSMLLVQTRWCLVMCHMERELYRDPSRDLDALWWDLVEEYQRVKRPADRRAPDWASKIHFGTAPVYYHNYVLGEIVASQLEHALLTHLAGDGADAWYRSVSSPEFGRFLTERLYRLGKSLDWREVVRRATGAPLRPDAFVSQLAASD